MIALKVDSLARAFGENIVVEDVSFEVKANSIHGFLGPNGAGKTTTLKMLAGILPASSGKIVYYEQKTDL